MEYKAHFSRFIELRWDHTFKIFNVFLGSYMRVPGYWQLLDLA